MELKEIEPRTLTDKIAESMSEAEDKDEAEYRPTPEAEQLLEPASINRPIPVHDKSIYEEPYSTNIYDDYKRFRIASDSNDQSRNSKWSLLCLIIGSIIGGIVTGLSMHFTQNSVCATLPNDFKPSDKIVYFQAEVSAMIVYFHL